MLVVVLIGTGVPASILQFKTGPPIPEVPSSHSSINQNGMSRGKPTYRMRRLTFLVATEWYMEREENPVLTMESKSNICACL